MDATDGPGHRFDLTVEFVRQADIGQLHHAVQILSFKRNSMLKVANLDETGARRVKLGSAVHILNTIIPHLTL